MSRARRRSCPAVDSARWACLAATRGVALHRAVTPQHAGDRRDSAESLMAGTVDGLIGGLFVGSEIRALHEFEWEIRNAIELAGGAANEEKPLKDWYD